MRSMFKKIQEKAKTYSEDMVKHSQGIIDMCMDSKDSVLDVFREELRKAFIEGALYQQEEYYNEEQSKWQRWK